MQIRSSIAIGAAALTVPLGSLFLKAHADEPLPNSFAYPWSPPAMVHISAELVPQPAICFGKTQSRMGAAKADPGHSRVVMYQGDGNTLQVLGRANCATNIIAGISDGTWFSADPNTQWTSKYGSDWASVTVCPTSKPWANFVECRVRDAP
jgi:hypothetical protein